MSKKFLIKYNYSIGTNYLKHLIINYILNLYKFNNLSFYNILFITFKNKTRIKIIYKIIKIIKKLTKKNNNKYLIAKIIHNNIKLSYNNIKYKSFYLLKNIFNKQIPIYTINNFLFYIFKKKYYFYKNINFIIQPVYIYNFLNYILNNKVPNSKYIKNKIYNISFKGYYKIIKNFKKKILILIKKKNFFSNLNLKYINNKIYIYIKKKKKIKLLINKIKKNFFLLLINNKINNKSFIYNDIFNLFNLKINYKYFKEVYLLKRLIINNRLKKNLKNNIFYSKSLNINQKKRIDINKNIIKKLILQYKNLIKNSTYKYILYNNIIEYYIYKFYFAYTVNKNNKIFKLYKNIFSNRIIKSCNKYKLLYIYKYHLIDYKLWRLLIIIFKNLLSYGYKIILFGDIRYDIYNKININKIIFKEYRHNIILEKNIIKNINNNLDIVKFNNNLFKFINNRYIDNKLKYIYDNSIQLPLKKENGYISIDILNYYDNKYIKILLYIKKILIEGNNTNDIVILLKDKIQVYDYIKELNYYNKYLPKIIFKNYIYLNDSIHIKILLEFLKIILYDNILKYKIKFILLLNKILKKKIKIIPKYFNNINNFLYYLKLNNLIISYIKLLNYNIYGKILYISNILKINNNSLYNFLDIIQEFELNESNNIYNFLNFWSYNKYKYVLNKTNNTNIIRVLSINKNRNQFYKIVILPLFSFNIFYNSNKIFNDLIFYKELNKKYIKYFINKKQISYFNILYNLIYSATNKLNIFLLKSTNKYNIYNLFKNFLINNNKWKLNKNKYIFGKNNKYIKNKNKKKNKKCKYIYLKNKINNIIIKKKENKFKFIIKKIIKNKFTFIKEEYYYKKKILKFNNLITINNGIFLIKIIKNKKYNTIYIINKMYKNILLLKEIYNNKYKIYKGIIIIINNNNDILFTYKI
ncbi:MAG: hypothetical protein NHF88_00375 [Candidatus Shikimatogenerans bostrichidophilus]|nr:MAG: hypothetical protein NHF88_00375 [Candidatus Shikimatogenerans bostrichidophilus]